MELRGMAMKVKGIIHGIQQACTMEIPNVIHVIEKQNQLKWQAQTEGSS